MARVVVCTSCGTFNVRGTGNGKCRLCGAKLPKPQKQLKQPGQKGGKS